MDADGLLVGDFNSGSWGSDAKKEYNLFTNI